jgi:hypothetical protein
LAKGGSVIGTNIETLERLPPHHAQAIPAASAAALIDDPPSPLGDGGTS